MTNAWIAFKFQTFSINLWCAFKQGKYQPSLICNLTQQKTKARQAKLSCEDGMTISTLELEMDNNTI